MTDSRDVSRAVALFRQFLIGQDRARAALQEQYPGEPIDLYQEHLEDLFANLNVLMYYKITPKRLDSLLKLNKAHQAFQFLDEEGVDLDDCCRIVENLQTLLYKQGQLNSFRQKKPVDGDGRPIPWITYPALEFIAQFNYADCDILELGAGYSTLFWANRARWVVSLETNREWFEVLDKFRPANVEMFYCETARELVSAVDGLDRLFAVIVIDSSKYRYDAVLSAMGKIAGGGIVVLDNADWYPQSCRLLRDAQFEQVDFHGFGPINGYTWTTSVFFRNEIRLPRIEPDMHPIGGIVTVLEDDGPRDPIRA
jgi:hypothetical protein